MPIIDVTRNSEALALEITLRFDASVERVWRLWEDPRQLERWWGPPTYPATVVDHDLRPGGHVNYYMTGPEGDQHKGYWRVREVEPPTRLVFEDGFADDEGVPNDEMPVTGSEVTIEPAEGSGTTMRIHSRFPSAEAMQQLLDMGMEEGIREATSQIDALLAED
ncbi:MAG: SRPBCC family protein [Nitriliruptorales bacterium]